MHAMVEHSPAPWHLRPWFDGKACVVTLDENGAAKLVIAKVEDTCDSADARLIAAAPKLYYACWLIDVLSWEDGKPCDGFRFREAVAMAREAINEIRGATP